ncbi:MAG: cytochrome c biogenesis CcdA family protein [Candidatus Dormibacteria bacterium]
MNLVDAGIAAGAGALSITSPCCLPLLPGYLGYLTGVSASQGVVRRRRVVTAAALFILGFTVVFAALGATASEVGDFLLQNRPLLYQLAGVFIALMGLIILVSGHIPLLNRTANVAGHVRGGSLWSATPLGAAFAVTYTPCLGPILGAILTLAAASRSLVDGVGLLIIYSLGLGIPLLLLSLSITRVHRLLSRARRGIAIARSASAVVLISMGVLLVTNSWLPLMAPLLRWYAQAQWPPV